MSKFVYIFIYAIIIGFFNLIPVSFASLFCVGGSLAIGALITKISMKENILQNLLDNLSLHENIISNIEKKYTIKLK